MRRVDKYGGTSMAQPHIVLDKVRQTDPDVVVVSAPGRDIQRAGTYTGQFGLEKMTDLLQRGEMASAMSRANEIVGRSGLAGERQSDVLRQFCAWVDRYSEHEAGRMAAGEYLSALIVSEATGRVLLDPQELVYVRPDKTPEISLSVQALKRVLSPTDRRRYVMPGFYGCATHEDASLEVLSRGGSDTTGALVALALGAMYYNFSDSDGIYTADPNMHPDARHISSLTYARAADIAAGGAAILHGEVSRILRGSECETIVASTFDNARHTRISDLEGADGGAHAAATHMTQGVYSAL